jgi:hypothetical protein
MRLQQQSFDIPIAIIGDIHGNLQQLQEILKLIGDRPILVTGDVGDRGPDTKGVLDLLLSRKAHGVLGNHDEWLRDYALGGQFDEYALNLVMGGRQTLASYGITGSKYREITAEYRKIPKAHSKWLNSLPVVLDLTVQGTQYWLSHAGVPSPMAMPPISELSQVMPQVAAMSTEISLWHSLPPQRMIKLDRTLIMGHKVQTNPIDLGHVIAIDTGCGFCDGLLSAVLLPERKFISVP